MKYSYFFLCIFLTVSYATHAMYKVPDKNQKKWAVLTFLQHVLPIVFRQSRCEMQGLGDSPSTQWLADSERDWQSICCPSAAGLSVRI